MKNEPVAPHRILIAADAFKEALSAQEVCAALARGVQRALPDAVVRQLPLADGGEGTAAILAHHLHAELRTCLVQDPIGRPVQARYALARDARIAVIEMAEAAGLALLEPALRNPLHTSTVGVGQLMLEALAQGAQKILLAIGGSATNDAGLGMAAAFGYRFLDAAGHDLAPIGANLGRVQHIAAPARLPFFELEVLCDVSNPLYGPDGAAWVYAAQKGADAEAIAYLDAGLEHLAGCFRKVLGSDVAMQPGAGAAGGLGAGAQVFLHGRLLSGTEAVLRYAGFEEALASADFLLSGEGRIDAQSAQGKLLSGLCAQAAAAGVPVIAFCGRLSLKPDEVAALGLLSAFSIAQGPESLEAALANTAEHLEQAAWQVCRLLNCQKR